MNKEERSEIYLFLLSLEIEVEKTINILRQIQKNIKTIKADLSKEDIVGLEVENGKNI